MLFESLDSHGIPWKSLSRFFLGQESPEVDF